MDNKEVEQMPFSLSDKVKMLDKMISDNKYLQGMLLIKKMSKGRWHPETFLKKMIVPDKYKPDLVRIIMELESCD